MMKRLFIIGNGFDLFHELPTSYDDFKNYLIKNDLDYFVEIFKNTDSKKMTIYLNEYDKKDFKKFECKLRKIGFLGEISSYNI